MEAVKESKNKKIFNKSKVEEIQITSINNFKNKVKINSSVTLHHYTLESAFNDVILNTTEQKKCVLLFLHKSSDEFSKCFCKSLKECNSLIEIINRSFHLIGWDIDDTDNHDGLKIALLTYNLHESIEFNKASLYFIGLLDNTFGVLTKLSGSQTNSALLEKFLFVEKSFNENTEVNNNKEENDTNCFGAIEYQQLMAELLGDRDYDSFDFNQHDALKQKIGFALYGQPKTESGEYNSKQIRKIENLYTTILTNSNLVAEYKDRVEISFIYNCTEPLPSEKKTRAKTMKDYNPKADFCPEPIFVLRKCRESVCPCRIFIDDFGRVYTSLEHYMGYNKLPCCTMLLPKDGRYDFDNNGNVLLEPKTNSPACGGKSTILKGADAVSTVGVLASAGIFGVAAAVSVAPAVVIAGAGIGIGAGIYSIGRSIGSLIDRGQHQENLSFANSEARSAYLNIIAGSLGFVGAGANLALSQFALRGFQIRQGVNVAVNTINVVNIGASGVSVVNSGYDVIDQWINENQAPSLRSIAQLSASVFFFGNALFSFKTAGAIINDAQTGALKQYSESLRSNRHKKTFDKLVNSIIRKNDGNAIKGRAEVISTIRTISNPKDVLATLRSKSEKFRRSGIRYSTKNEGVTLNNIAINLNELATTDYSDVKIFLSKIETSNGFPQTVREITSITGILNALYGISSYLDIQNACSTAEHILSGFNVNIRELILNGVHSLIEKMANEIKIWLQDVFPKLNVFVEIMEVVVKYFKRFADELEGTYQLWKNTKDSSIYNSLFDFVPRDQIQRLVFFFEKCLERNFIDELINENSLNNLYTYFLTWFTRVQLDDEEKCEQQEQCIQHSGKCKIKVVDCKSCGGKYFKST